MFDLPASFISDASCPCDFSSAVDASRRFLVVEDDPAVSRVLTRSLRARGFAVDLAASAAAALASAAAAAPDYVILELKVGGASTLPLIRPLRAASPSARLCVVTGYAGIATAVEAIKLGACHYLAKPAPLEEILFRLGVVAMPARESGERRPGASRGPRRRAVRDSQFALDDIEWRHILHTLRECGGNVAEAARRLKMHRRTLYRKITARGDADAAAALERMRHGERARRELSGSTARTAAAGAATALRAA
ncbi:MAG: response regulator [Rhodocyclaceae bacterium]|nr:response regulator [Rhodocyclaceae bacterium]